MSDLPTHIGGYQHLAPDVIIHDEDIFVLDGQPTGFVGNKGWQGSTVGEVEFRTKQRIYRRIPVAKQGDTDTTGWQKVQAGVPYGTPVPLVIAPTYNGPSRIVEPGDAYNPAQGCCAPAKAALPTDAKARKGIPIATGVLDYFPKALAEVARVSLKGNEQHHAGEPLHWDKSKSTDEADALIRHFMERGKIDTDGMRHSAKTAWRALALLERELDSEGGL
jgi:hypothetical protein